MWMFLKDALIFFRTHWTKFLLLVLPAAGLACIFFYLSGVEEVLLSYAEQTSAEHSSAEDSGTEQKGA